MIIEIKGQINYFREPLPDIFDKLRKNGDSKAFSLLNGLRDEIGEKGGDHGQNLASEDRGNI